MKNFSEKLEFEKAQKIKDKINSIKDIESKILLSSINENFKDIIVFKKIKNDKYKFLILKISKEIILKKEEFELENQTFSNNILEEFLKIYYRENQIPDSIIIEDIINGKFETFLSKKRGKNIKIIIPKKADNLKLLNLAILNLESSMNFNLENSLKEKLNLKQIPNTIECFDMSNFSYEDLVGAMVRFKNQKKDTKNYRKYEIKSFSNKNDDYKSFREVMFRRYFKNSDLSNTELSKVIFDNRLKVNISTDKIIELPNLIICDGGVGQLNSTIKILKELKIYEKIDVVSLAKKEEIIYKYENEELVEFDLNNNSSEMLYIRKIRDSVHNFVITFNRSKRKSLK